MDIQGVPLPHPLTSPAIPPEGLFLLKAKFMMMYPHQRDIIQNNTKTCSSLCQGLLNFLRNLQNLKFAFKLFIILNRQHIISQNLEITS